MVYDEILDTDLNQYIDIYIENGFTLEDKSNSTVWSGSFNIHTSISIYQKITNNCRITLNEINKESDRWSLGEHQVSGTVEFNNVKIKNFSIESKKSFSFFKRKTELEDFYRLHGEYQSFVKNKELRKILIQLNEIEGVLIIGRNSRIEFDFHLGSLKKDRDKVLIMILKLIQEQII